MPASPDLTPAQCSAFGAIRLGAVAHAPYLAAAIFRLAPVVVVAVSVDGAPARASHLSVDRSWRLYLDAASLDGPDAWPVAVAAGALQHAIGHLLRDHASRADALGVAAAGALPTWNTATDAALNDDLVAAGVPLPAGSPTPEALGLEPNGIEEEYYQQLLLLCSGDAGPPLPGPPGGAGGQPGDRRSSGEAHTCHDCGSGAGGATRDFELAAGDALVPGVDADTADLLRRMVAEDLIEHQRQRGSVPAGWRLWADNVLNPAGIPWRQLLATQMRKALSRSAGQLDYTYSRPGRRRVPGVLTPSLFSPQPTLCCIVDTSASMNTADLAAALTEVGDIARRCGVRGRDLLLMCVDAAAGLPRPVRRIQDVELVGGGGTDMGVGIQACAARRDIDLCVVFTDGFTDWPEHPPKRLKVIVAVIDQPDVATPAWAGRVDIPVG